MYGEEGQRFTDAELHAFFVRLFPDGFAGADVLAAGVIRGHRNR